MLNRKSKPTKQQCKKLFDGSCFLCKESNYNLLDAHRIIYGGVYENYNLVTLCKNCHRRVHCNEVKFDRKYYSTKGIWILHWWRDNEEFWTEIKN